MPGSLKVAVSVNGLPVLALRVAGTLTAGATLVIVAVVVTGALAAPFESVTVSLTV